MSKGDGSDKDLESDIQELERVSAQMPRLIVAIFMGIAMLSLGIAVVLTVGAARSRAREVRVPGYVVDMTVRRDQQGQELYYPVVTFTLPDGTRKTVQLAEGSWPQPYQVDEDVIVAYDPQRPLKVRIASDGSGWLVWIGPLITGAVGLAFLGATFFTRWFLKGELEKASRKQG